ncbi:hypothetical protein M3Y95_00801400 [Aphelenchoides besseyi]|nr:hypothetical protein M3Y95_00801400 [Aphelenchoides besseyi]
MGLVLLCLFSLLVLCRSDPIPHSDHSKLFLLSKLAFNYLDADGDGRLSTKEMAAIRDFSVNGISTKSDVDLLRMKSSMDMNKNNFVEESEFTKFDFWLPVFINGRPKSPIHLRDLKRYGNSIAYSQLDSNQDGVIDHKELAFDQ